MKMSKNKNFIDEEILSYVGYSSSNKNRSGFFFIIDDYIANTESLNRKLEISPLSKAIEKHLWLRNYVKSIPKKPLGYFIRVIENAKIDFPIQACFYTKKSKSQIIHNIFVAEPNSKAHLISGCTTSIQECKHTGISHYLIKDNASLSVTRIHHWLPTTSVFSKSSTLVKKNGIFISNYIVLYPPKKEQSHSITNVKENGTTRFNTVVYAKEYSNFNINDEVFLEEKNARSEIINKALSKGGKVITRGHIQGRGENTKGHMECNGLLLNDRGKIETMPALEAINSKTDLSHEAGIGRISGEELNYLMSRGIDEETAKSLIVRGFLDVEIKGLPEQLQKFIHKLIKKISIEGTT